MCEQFVHFQAFWLYGSSGLHLFAIIFIWLNHRENDFLVIALVFVEKLDTNKTRLHQPKTKGLRVYLCSIPERSRRRFLRTFQLFISNQCNNEKKTIFWGVYQINITAIKWGPSPSYIPTFFCTTLYFYLNKLGFMNFLTWLLGTEFLYVPQNKRFCKL